MVPVVKNPPANAGDSGWSLGWDNPLKKEMATHSYSCLENSMDRGAWWATVRGVTESDMTEHMTHFPHRHTYVL